MKYILVIGDGMADNPVPELGGKTPIEYAKTPVMDYLAARGELGSTYNIPEGLPPGSVPRYFRFRRDPNFAIRQSSAEAARRG